jgi:hypothetical protein
MESEESEPRKQPYEKPTATKVNREQAKLKLMGHAMLGDEQAKELLDILFQQEELSTAKQPYEKPMLTEITMEQLKLKLMGDAMMGSKQAKEMLGALFENSKQNNDCTGRKKSA